MKTKLIDSMDLNDDSQPIDVSFEASSRQSAPRIDKTSGLPMLSRRAMLGGLATSTLAMGGMMLLPKEGDGVLFMGTNPLGAEKAYADNSNVWSGTFSFDVVGSDQVGIQIMDVSGLSDLDDETVEKQGTPVEGATVTLTSLYNEKTVSDQTDEEGKVILSIRALAFSEDPSDGVIRANCALSVTTEDARVQMRDFSTGRVCLEGATGYVIGVHELDDDDVYMELCTFNDWDIHYSKLTFLRSGTNSATHTVKVRAKGLKDGDSVTMEALDAKEKKTILKTRTAQVKVDSKTGLAECSFEGHFLQTGHDDCISANDAILRITLTPKSNPHVTDIEIFIEDTPFDDVKLGGPILPIMQDPNRLLTFTASGDWPCFNGLSFSVLGPFPKVQISTTILTTFIGFGSDLRMMDDKGRWAPKDCWQTDHKGNIKKRYQNMVDRKRAQYAQNRAANKDVEMSEMKDPGNPDEEVQEAGSQNKKFLGFGQVNIIGQIACFFQWNGETGDASKLNGEASIALGISASGTFTLNFMAGPVPMYLSGTIGFTIAGYLSAAAERSLVNTVKEFDASDMQWSVNMATGLLLKVLLAISLGVGYKGVCSFSFDATFTFPIYFGWLQKGGEGKGDPHITVGVTILLEFVLQALCFRLSGQVFSYQKNNWYDSWKDDSVSDTPALTGDAAWEGRAPRFKLNHGDGKLRHTIAYDEHGNPVLGGEDPWSLAVPTTDTMMKVSKEANATRIGGGDSTSATTASAVFVNKMPKAVVKNGEIVTELVDCEGVNTFYFCEVPPDMAADAIAISSASAAAGATGTSAGTPASLVAASSEALGAAPHFEGDPLLGFAEDATAEYTYDFDTIGKTTGNPCNPIGIASIGAHDGVVPNVNAVIYKDVHSDPRQRVVEIDGTPYLFRIVTVQYPTATSGSYCRTRVVASKYDTSSGKWGTPTVLEYDTGNASLPRVSIYDYEFDIAVRSGDKKWTQDGEACLIVTGGLRPDGDNTSFHDAACNGTVAVLVIDKDLKVLNRIVRGVQGIDNSSAKLAFDESQEHMLCSPCIVDGFANGGASGSLAYAFLRRSASTKEGLTSTNATVTFCVGHCYVRDGNLSFPSDMKEDTSIKLAADVFGMKAAVGDAVSGKYDSLLTLVINHQNGYDVCSAIIPPDGDFSNLQIKHCIKSSDKLPEIQPWPHHGTFLYVKERPATEDGTPDYHLYAGDFDPTATGKTSFTPKQMDTTGLKGASFCVGPNGDFIFYYEMYHDIPDSNPDAEFVSSNVTGTGDDTVHHIMASRLINGKFCEDFPFCEIDHPVDRLEVLNLAGEASSFVATHITDANNSLADIHYIGVPNVLSASIDAFVQTEPFVCAGHPADFSMDVKNHGNLIIGGFDVQMIDPNKSGALIETVHVGQIEPSKINLTAANMGWGPTASDTPRLTAEEQQGMLMPGKKISYAVTFNIPEEWTGNKTVVLRIANAWTPEMQVSGASVESVGAEAAFGLAEAENGMVIRGQVGDVHHFHQAKEGSVSLVNTGQGDGSIYDPDEHKGTSSEPMPKLGDRLGLASPLALAAAGASALVAGYSARRLQNEREARKAAEGDEAEEA